MEIPTHFSGLLKLSRSKNGLIVRASPFRVKCTQKLLGSVRHSGAASQKWMWWSLPSGTHSHATLGISGRNSFSPPPALLTYSVHLIILGIVICTVVTWSSRDATNPWTRFCLSYRGCYFCGVYLTSLLLDWFRTDIAEKITPIPEGATRVVQRMSVSFGVLVRSLLIDSPFICRSCWPPCPNTPQFLVRLWACSSGFKRLWCIGFWYNFCGDECAIDSTLDMFIHSRAV